MPNDKQKKAATEVDRFVLRAPSNIMQKVRGLSVRERRSINSQLIKLVEVGLNKIEEDTNYEDRSVHTGQT